MQDTCGQEPHLGVGLHGFPSRSDFFFFFLCNVYSHHPISGRKGTFTDLQSREFFVSLSGKLKAVFRRGGRL